LVKIGPALGLGEALVVCLNLGEALDKRLDSLPDGRVGQR